MAMAYWLDLQHEIHYSDDYAERGALHVCSCAYEAAALYCLYHAGHRCPRCVGPLVMVSETPQPREIFAVADAWLRDPSHDVHRARGSALWNAFCRVEAEAWAAMQAQKEKEAV